MNLKYKGTKNVFAIIFWKKLRLDKNCNER